MSIKDLELYTVNTLVVAISFSNIESALKIILLVASIVYTIVKTIDLLKTKKNNGSNNTE